MDLGVVVCMLGASTGALAYIMYGQAYASIPGIAMATLCITPLAWSSSTRILVVGLSSILLSLYGFTHYTPTATASIIAMALAGVERAPRARTLLIILAPLAAWGYTLLIGARIGDQRYLAPIWVWISLLLASSVYIASAPGGFGGLRVSTVISSISGRVARSIARSSILIPIMLVTLSLLAAGNIIGVLALITGYRVMTRWLGREAAAGVGIILAALAGVDGSLYDGFHRLESMLRSMGGVVG